jgi:tetratricopeptide (TPR) repeat protein
MPLLTPARAALAVVTVWSAPLRAAEPAAAAPDRAQAYFQFVLGQQARIEGRTAAAIEALRRAQRLDPQSGEIRAELARLLREGERFDEALAEAREAVRLSPDDADTRRILALLYRDQAQNAPSAHDALRKAAEQYEAVARLEAADGQALLSLVQIYMQLEDAKNAVGALERYVMLDPGNAGAHLRLGSLYLAQREAEKAAGAFSRVLELQPDSAQGFASLGDAYAQAQQIDQAVLNYRKALELDPENAQVRVDLGDLLFDARRLREALAEADALLAQDAANLYGLDLRARALRDLKDYDAAQATAESARQRHPDDVKIAFLRVTIAEARRDYVAAVTQLEQLVRPRELPREADREANQRLFLVHLGAAYQQLGRFADAADAFRRARDAGEPNADIDGYHVDALLRAKDPRALAEAQAARTRFPEEIELGVLEAVAREAAGDVEGAKALSKTLAESANQAVALAQVAEFHQRGRRYAEAERLLERARTADPKNARVLFQLGAARERQGRHDDAESAFREALALEPQMSAVLNYLGYMNANRNVRLEEAHDLIRKALELDPENGAYLDSLGWALFRLGRVTEAETWLRKALAKQAGGAVVLDHLGDVLAALGRRSEALELWRRALAGEDEDGELDRAAVQRKVQDAQAALAPPPPTP